ncbi:MAG: hypothetical protein BWY91_00928 [bacterium ADurb.BinA028]|nr:MAG: hypothetical protein BWY91_00928 [bacterium ADurb.BinA028]
MKFRVYHNERFLFGRLPRGGWRFSVLLVYRLSEDSTVQWVTVPWLGAAGSFLDRRGKDCPSDQQPRYLAQRAVEAEIARRFGPEAATTPSLTTSWKGDHDAFIETPAAA